MKNMMLVVFVSLFTTALVSAGDDLELQVINGDPTIDYFLSGRVSNGKWGWSAFALVNRDWAQAYAGPTFAPTTWSSVSLNVGVETGGRRFAEALWIGKGRFSSLAIYEHGYSGHWHKITVDWSITKTFAVGYHDQAFVGRGPRVSLKLPGAFRRSTVWGSLLLKDGHLGTVVAYKFTP